MARHLNFTESRDDVLRASTWVEFRVSIEQVAWACSFATHEKESTNPRLTSKSEIEKTLRSEIQYRGLGAYIDIEHPEVEELYAESLEHVKGIYGVER